LPADHATIAAIKAIESKLDSLYTVLSDEQRKKADQLLGRLRPDVRLGATVKLPQTSEAMKQEKMIATKKLVARSRFAS
jgi:hypothetical protein